MSAQQGVKYVLYAYYDEKMKNEAHFKYLHMHKLNSRLKSST